MSYSTSQLRKYTGWLPSNPKVRDSFIKKHVDLATKHQKTFAQYQPAVQKFKEAMQGDPDMKDLFNQMFLQASPKNMVSNSITGQ